MGLPFSCQTFHYTLFYHTCGLLTEHRERRELIFHHFVDPWKNYNDILNDKNFKSVYSDEVPLRLYQYLPSNILCRYSFKHYAMESALLVVALNTTDHHMCIFYQPNPHTTTVWTVAVDSRTHVLCMESKVIPEHLLNYMLLLLK
jgi:hypothetical protein